MRILKSYKGNTSGTHDYQRGQDSAFVWLFILASYGLKLNGFALKPVPKFIDLDSL